MNEMAEHEHHHNHHDGCGCEDEHCGIEIAEHEGALIGTLSGHVTAADVEEARDILAGEMKKLAVLINEAGGVIGHIKAIASEEGRGYQISVTEEDAQIRVLGPSAYRADTAVIVFAVDEETLHGFMEQTVGTVIVPDDDDDCCED